MTAVASDPPRVAIAPCQLTAMDPRPLLEELYALRVASAPEVPRDIAIYRHTEHVDCSAKDGHRVLTVIYNTETYDAFQAHAFHFGIRRWRHVSVGIRGALAVRLADQRTIGRMREGGERSPAPLPDWYDLTHIAYGHAETFGFDPTQPVYQLLPPPAAEGTYLNIAEALHLRQPA